MQSHLIFTSNFNHYDESCGCIFEIPKESMIKKSTKEDPRRNIRKQLIEKLQLNNRKELDSLENLTENFILDATFMKQNKIKTIARDSEKKIVTNPNFCKDGILSITKPIFNREYNIAVLDYGHSYACIAAPLAIYSFKNGKWKRYN